LLRITPVPLRSERNFRQRCGFIGFGSLNLHDV
jgi:hypothetical protein